jgi:hypothetical protein
VILSRTSAGQAPCLSLASGLLDWRTGGFRIWAWSSFEAAAFSLPAAGFLLGAFAPFAWLVEADGCGASAWLVEADGCGVCAWSVVADGGGSQEAKDRRELYERSKRRRVNPLTSQGNSVAPETVPFVTPKGDPILPGDFLHQLRTAYAAGKFVIPGTARDPVVSDFAPQPSASTSQADAPQPSASTSQADAPQPSASTSQEKGAKAPRRQPAAGRKKAAASKEDHAQILNPPVLLSPIAPKPTKGKALVRPRSETKSHAQGLEEVVSNMKCR